MILPHVLLRLPDDTVAAVPADGVVGRLRSAALRLTGRGVSQAHALVSLRHGELRLLALRGASSWRPDSGEPALPLDDIPLEPGQEILLGEDLVLIVDDVVLPDRVPAIEVGGELFTMPCERASLTLEPRPALHPRLIPEADLWLWIHGDALWARAEAAPPRRIRPGDPLPEPAGSARLLEVPVAGTGVRTTHGVEMPLLVEVWRTRTVIRSSGDTTVTLTGRAAAIVRELVLFRHPTHWRELAEHVWEEAEVDLRANFDRHRKRIASRLRAAGLRTDLVLSRGDGTYALNLGRNDRLLDRTFDDPSSTGGG